MSKDIIKEAAQHIATSYSYDELIELKELDEILQTEEPTQGSMVEFKAAQMVRMARIDAVSRVLLKEYKLLMKNVFGEGYILVHPEDQVKISMRESQQRIKKEITKASARVRNLRVDEISDKARQEQEDANNKLAAFEQFMKRNR